VGVMIMPVRCRGSDECSAAGRGAALECFGHGYVECRDDGSGDGGLGLIRGFLAIVEGFGIACFPSVEAELVM